ncbi:MAG: hypothetical protein RIA08_17135 [Roseovarius sp.]|uniref:hypothetical protein n=1 Tax=Roseovarius sp. TaxID=1486281 RepID=UPI0032F03A24
MKPETRKFLLQNTSLGALFGVVIGGAFVCIIESDLDGDYVKYGTYGITVIVGLVASTLALTAALSNIENQNQVAQEVRNAALSAAKATLPLALTELSHICERGAELSLKRNAGPLSSSGDIEPGPLIEELLLSKESLSAIKETIQFSDPSDKDHLADLVLHVPSFVFKNERFPVL